MRLRTPGPLDLEATLYSGQTFRWRREGVGWHAGYVRNRPVLARAGAGWLEWEGEGGLTSRDLARYFRLDASHERFVREVRRDDPLERAMERFPGLRLLNQEPWEVFVAYLVSQNSNIGKITRTLESLARLAGDRVDWRGRTWMRFPDPEQMARLSLEDLRSTGMGYRAPYVRDAAQLVASGRLRLDALRRLRYEKAKDRLLEIPGVGPKVADCILLYGLGHWEAFPTDVWIERAMRELYFRRPVAYERVGEFARSHFGPHAGYAQHFLFHYRRVVGPLAAPAVAHR